MDEVHCGSTIPYNEEMVETGLSCSSQCAQVTGNDTAANALSKQDTENGSEKRGEIKSSEIKRIKLNKMKGQLRLKKQEHKDRHLRNVKNQIPVM